MAKRISRSLLDPVFAPRIKQLYERLRIPASFPPEAVREVNAAETMPDTTEWETRAK